jgi:biopolymer transport protein ExbD
MSGSGDGDEATAFDLTALMDVLSNLIFFLMASFGAAVVAGLPASVPTIAESGDNDTATEMDKVTATVQIKATGEVDVTVANNEMLPDELKPYARKIAPKDGGVDTQALTTHLFGVKEKFRKSKDIILVPADDVTYEMLVQVMDATREKRELVNGAWVFPELFPAVTVSSLVK